MKPYDKIHEALAVFRDILDEDGRQHHLAPRVGLVLGSGLGAFADEMMSLRKHPFEEVPHFPSTGVKDHKGNVCFGQVGGVNVVALQGRVHYYEGHDMDTVVFPVRVMVAMGIEVLIVTNAAGGVDRDYKPGDLVLAKDHVNLMGMNPLRGPNDERLGPRFPDMTQVYSPALRERAKHWGRTLGMELREGVYAAFSGPSYETPAEVEMARRAGATLVGMSTVPEVIAARHMRGADLPILGISCVTNMAAGVTGEALSHDEVTRTASRVEEDFIRLLKVLIAGLPQTT